MTRPLVLLRPEPGWSAAANAARAIGLEVAGAPLFAVEPLAWEVPDPAAFDAILAGSANAFRHGGPGLSRLVRLPVHAVGAATADAARAAGFVVEQVGSGGLQSVLDTLPPQCLLRLAGEAHVALRIPAGIAVATRILYRSRPLALDAAGLPPKAVVALHSAEAARHFAAECDRLAIPREGFAIAALGPRIAAAAGSGWSTIHIAEHPDEAALLAMARQMCHTL